MISIVTFLWDTGNLHSKKRLKFTAEHVNVLYRMCKKNIDVPFEFFCVTDQMHEDFDYKINLVPLWDDFAECGSCFRRLKLFDESSRHLFGDRIIQIDLDTVITGNITDVVQRQEPLIFFRSKARRTKVNGSYWSIVPGRYQHIYDNFDPVESRRQITSNMLIGSDQAWISLQVNDEDLTVLGADDGLYSYNVDIRKPYDNGLPDNARLVFFHGKFDPSQKLIQNQCEWVKQYWQ